MIIERNDETNFEKIVKARPHGPRSAGSPRKPSFTQTIAERAATDSEMKLLRKSCGGKRRYPGRQEAERAADVAMRDHRRAASHSRPIQPYFCRGCQAYHIGHTPWRLDPRYWGVALVEDKPISVEEAMALVSQGHNDHIC